MQQQRGNTLLEDLGLNLLDNTEQQLITRRVVIVGDALSGKRAFVSRLFAAAVQQFPSSSMATSSSQTYAANSSNSSAGGSSCCLPVLSSTGAAEAARTMGTEGPNSSRYFPQFPHGAGVTQAFILQRIPATRSAFLPTAEDGLSSSGLYSSGSGISCSAVLPGGVRRAMTEFFCCETPGALAMALPTVEALETSVVLLVVDTSVPWRLQDQMRRWYGYLNTHIMQTLRVDLPKQDEVRRMRMIEQQQLFWQVQQQELALMRRRWCEREGIHVGRSSNDKDSNTNYSLSVLQVPKGGISPLRTILLCTKTDQLEKLSREVGKFCHQSSSSAEARTMTSLENVNISVEPWVSHALLSSLRTSGLTLLELVGQLLRKEAIARQSALVAASSRVNTIATSSLSSSQQTTNITTTTTTTVSGGAAAAATPVAVGDRSNDETGPLGLLTNSHSVFVHPFYKNLWLYIFQLLYDPPTTFANSMVPNDILSARDHDDNDGGNGGCVAAALQGPEVSSGLRSEWGSLWNSLLDEMETQVSSRFHPHTFLPHGMDHLELLSPFVTSMDAVTLDSVFPSGTDEPKEADWGVLRLHDEYIQEIENVLATAGPNEEAMIWDKL
ncbi:hypothetical protein MOQ_005217 [Trypanosoma cruzi marinkellei]|uniref:Dynein light intermediate chain n=1 Tax=Trypanosoma cruzi marinkellei TaxID=85056 RepID=K2MYT9_TRYCR|nr:hypothetical protein MOQ_005217 [Trypanosoma cruzi marinkellei]